MMKTVDIAAEVKKPSEINRRNSAINLSDGRLRSVR